jgi:hypothetical protein
MKNNQRPEAPLGPESIEDFRAIYATNPEVNSAAVMLEFCRPMDSRVPGHASGTDPAMATLAPVNRAKKLWTASKGQAVMLSGVIAEVSFGKNSVCSGGC